MKGRTLLGLALLGLALVGAAVWLGAARQPDTATAERARLVPGLDAQLNAIARVRIASADGEAVLERGGSGWVVPDRGGWPVDTGKLRTLLLALAEARTLEPKTARPELHARLGVEDVGEGSGQGALVELVADGATHAVIVGNASATGSYARRAGEPQSWLLDRRIEVDRDPASWLQRELTQIDAQRVASVRIAHADGPPVEIVARNPGPGFDIANLPKGRQPASDYVAEATAGFLSALRLHDVGREGEAFFGEDADLSHARFALRDGIVVDVDFMQSDGFVVARFDPSLDQARAEAFAAAEQAKAAMEYERTHGADPANDDPPREDPIGDNPAGEDRAGEGLAGEDPAGEDAAGEDPASPAGNEAAPLAVTDPEADRAARVAALRAEVEALDQRLEGWIFTLPPYKAEHLTKPLADYLAPTD